MFFAVIVLSLCVTVSHAFSYHYSAASTSRARSLVMKVENDAFAKANRAARSAGAGDRMVELKLPLGLVLDEDKDGNVFVKSIDKGSRAEKSGLVFEGDIVGKWGFYFSVINYMYSMYCRIFINVCY